MTRSHYSSHYSTGEPAKKREVVVMSGAAQSSGTETDRSPKKAGGSKLDDGVKLSKGVTAQETEREKVAQIAVKAEDLSEPNSTAKAAKVAEKKRQMQKANREARNRAKAKRRQNQIVVIKDESSKECSKESSKEPIDLSGSKMKEELIKQGSVIKSLTGREKKKEKRKFTADSAKVQKVSRQRAEDVTGHSVKKENLDILQKGRKLKGMAKDNAMRAVNDSVLKARSKTLGGTKLQDCPEAVKVTGETAVVPYKAPDQPLS